MHLLTTTGTTLEEIAAPVDLRQTPGDVVVMSFADSDLAGLAAAWEAEKHILPSMRFVQLRDLRHPLSVDLWIEKVAVRAKVILVRLIGGIEWWRYGVEQLAALARAHNVKLAVLPGEDRDDPRLADFSTVPADELDRLLRFFREGGRENLRGLLRRLSGHAGVALEGLEPTPLPRLAAYWPDTGAIDVDALMGRLPPGRPVVPVIFYRALLLAGDMAVIDTLCEALLARGLAPAPLAVTSLKDSAAATFVRNALARLRPAVIVTTTAFAAGGEPGAPTPLDGPDVPVLQAVIASTRRSAWQESPRGLAAADLAMHVVLPELDGRVLAGAIAFKDTLPPHLELGFAALANRPEPDRIAMLAGRVAALASLRKKPRATRRIAVLMPDYPGAPGRTGYAVGLDVPASIVALLGDLAEAGYVVRDAPQTPRALLERVGWAKSPSPDGMGVPKPGAILPTQTTAKDGTAWAKSSQATAPDLAPGNAILPTLHGFAPLAHAADAADIPPRLRGGWPRQRVRPSAGPMTGSARPGGDPFEDRLGSFEQTRCRGEDPTPALPEDGEGDEIAPPEVTRLPVAAYLEWLSDLPLEATTRIRAAWGDPCDDPDVRDGAFRFRAIPCGNAIVALPPDRGRSAARRADYHDPDLPPRHALLAFGLWLRHGAKVDAVVHMGAHGTAEWLPGKAVALTDACFPELVLGSLPVFYPFIVSNPGEAAQAKRRIAAVTIGHLPPPLATTPLSGEARELEALVDEYAGADGLDRKRRERLAARIVAESRRTGLGREAGITEHCAPDEVLRRIDAWLCDLKDLAVKDGLHVYGRAPSAAEVDAAWRASAIAERDALLAALDGRRIPAGPAGAPSRGRRDVLPTGRNLYTADPRMLPTPTAMEFGRLAADEVIRGHLQAHGEMPRAAVIDLWGSATLRTGGEEIAHGLALMGCRPTWDAATGRVTGIEVLPPAAAGRPRVDVTWRISGLFRDLFPAQIALIDAAVRAVAAREESAEENPLAAACRAAPSGDPPVRIFGTAPGAYGAGVADLIGTDTDRAAVGAAYLAATSHAYGGPEATGTATPAFSTRVADADLLLHSGDDPGHDLLEGAEDVAFIGGFAAAAAALGRAPDLIMLDVTDPQRPRARPLAAALARIVRGRAINPRFIAGQMRHGPRGAAELAETVDRLIGFAQTTDAVASHLIDLVHDAYVADPQVRDFLLRENPAAAHSIASRLEAARRHGWWHPRRNDIDADLRELMGQPMAEAAP